VRAAELSAGDGAVLRGVDDGHCFFVVFGLDFFENLFFKHFF
jgi:hypothetical protein